MLMYTSDWLAHATDKLNKVSSSGRLDAMVILQAVTGNDKSYLLAHPEAQVPAAANELLKRRLKHEPIAYILGKKEFYGRDFTVTPSVLIPRPESEAFIDMLQQFAPLSGKHLLDVGTGSGALAITAKLENPRLQVYASDVSEAALLVAKQNAQNHKVDVTFMQSDLLKDVSQDFDIIIANLPYVPPDYEVSPDLSFEPAIALYAEHGGLALIEKLLIQTPGKLLPGGYLLIECLKSQHRTVIEFAKKHSLHLKDSSGLILVFGY